jgi:hypothetical protein
MPAISPPGFARRKSLCARTRPLSPRVVAIADARHRGMHHHSYFGRHGSRGPNSRRGIAPIDFRRMVSAGFAGRRFVRHASDVTSANGTPVAVSAHQRASDESHRQASAGSHRQASARSHRQPSVGSHRQASDESHRQASDESHRQASGGSHRRTSGGSHRQPSAGSHRQASGGSHQRASEESHRRSASRHRTDTRQTNRTVERKAKSHRQLGLGGPLGVGFLGVGSFTVCVGDGYRLVQMY